MQSASVWHSSFVGSFEIERGGSRIWTFKSNFVNDPARQSILTKSLGKGSEPLEGAISLDQEGGPVSIIKQQGRMVDSIALNTIKIWGMTRRIGISNRPLLEDVPVTILDSPCVSYSHPKASKKPNEWSNADETWALGQWGHGHVVWMRGDLTKVYLRLQFKRWGGHKEQIQNTLQSYNWAKYDNRE